MPPTTTTKTRAALPHRSATVLLLALIAALLAYSYYPAMQFLAERWWKDPDYTYGFFVPVFSGYLLWHRRSMMAAIPFRGSWWGLVLIGLAALMRIGSVYLFSKLPDAVSLIPCLAGVALIIGGWPALRWSWPAIFFLGFMVPVPDRAAGLLSHPLQRVGAIVSAAIIQTMGIPSVVRGNIIVLPKTELGVAEACNGLPMMMLFFAVCFGAVFLSNRHWIEKLIILASAAPIAILANVIRITGTALLYQFSGVELGDKIFHDLAGWFMMPVAVALLWLLLWILDHALISPETQEPLLIQ